MSAKTSLIAMHASQHEEASQLVETPQLLQFSRPGSRERRPDFDLAPMLALIDPLPAEPQIKARKLFLVPTPQGLEGELPDSEYLPKPSPLSELPPLTETVNRFVLGVVEIWGGRRQPMQLARFCHRLVYAKIQALSGNQKEIPKIRKVYITEPIEGVAETTVTLRFNERVRSLVLRFEGVDQRWLCTEFVLL
jgi:hypothetical protein